MQTQNEARYDEIHQTVTLTYREDGRNTIETFKANDLLEAGMLTVAKQWRLTDNEWNYSALEGYTIGIERI
jgi:hypothetical protein